MVSFADDLKATLGALRENRLHIRLPRVVGLFRRQPGTHFHGTPELFIQTGGGTDFECPGGTFRLRTKEVCVMPSGVPHAEHPIDLRTPYSILVCLQGRDGFWLRRATATKTSRIVGGSAEHYVSARGQAAFRYLDEIAALGSLAEKYRRPLSDSLLQSFILSLLGELDCPTRPPAVRSPLVAEAEKMARANFGDSELSVARLAASLGCSADYLSRRFHQEREIPFAAWIARERVAHAKDILRDLRFNIAEVGWACGFSGPSYFIRVFRKHTGLTPRAFRLAAIGSGLIPSA